MTYFVPKTLDDLLEMKERGDSENATLEFKSCRIFEQKNDKVFGILSKEITAFANSIGGVLIIGIEENDDRSMSEVVPIADGRKDESWIEDGLLSRITPSLHFSVTRIEVSEGHILVVDVPASRNAPHQSADRRYYARRLFRVDQLLAFEIDDIRRRAVASAGGANLAVLFQSGTIFFEIENAGIGPMFDIWIAIEGIENTTIAREWSPKLCRPYIEPFKILHSREKRSFPGAGFHFFQNLLEDRMDIQIHYTDEDEKKHQRTYTYYLKDFESTTRLRTPQEELFQQAAQSLGNLEKSLSSLSQDIHEMKECAFFPSGFNLSKTTLSSIAGNEEFKWPGGALSVQALSEILEVDFETAFKIQSEVFGAVHYMGGQNTPLEKVELPEDVKERILRLLVLP